MPSTRLTKEMKEQIASKILSKAYIKKEKSIEEQRFAFSERVYKDIYKKELDQMNDLPQGWLPESSEFTVQFGGRQTGYCRRMLREPKRFQAHHVKRYNQCIKIYSDNHKFTKKHDALTEKWESIREEKKNAERSIWAMLNSCNTTKQLKEAWPEIAKYVEIFEPASERSTAVAPIMDNLNKQLGLKKAA